MTGEGLNPTLHLSPDCYPPRSKLFSRSLPTNWLWILKICVKFEKTGTKYFFTHPFFLQFANYGVVAGFRGNIYINLSCTCSFLLLDPGTPNLLRLDNYIKSYSNLQISRRLLGFWAPPPRDQIKKAFSIHDTVLNLLNARPNIMPNIFAISRFYTCRRRIIR